MKKQLLLLVALLLLAAGFASAVPTEKSIPVNSSYQGKVTLTQSIEAHYSSGATCDFYAAPISNNCPALSVNSDYIDIKTTMTDIAGSGMVFFGIRPYPNIVRLPNYDGVQVTYGSCVVYYDNTILPDTDTFNIEAGHAALVHCRLFIPSKIAFDMSKTYAVSTILTYLNGTIEDLTQKPSTKYFTITGSMSGAVKFPTPSTASPNPSFNQTAKEITWAFNSNLVWGNKMIMQVGPDWPCDPVSNRWSKNTCRISGNKMICSAFNNPNLDTSMNLLYTGETTFEPALVVDLGDLPVNKLQTTKIMSGASVSGNIAPTIGTYEYCFAPGTSFNLGVGSFYLLGDLPFNYTFGRSTGGPAWAEIKINNNQVLFKQLPATLEVPKQKMLEYSRYGENDLNVTIYKNGVPVIANWLTAYSTKFKRIRILQPGKTRADVEPFFNSASYPIVSSEPYTLGLLNIYKPGNYYYKLEVLTPGTGSEVSAWKNSKPSEFYVNKCNPISQRIDPSINSSDAPKPQLYQDFTFLKTGNYSFKASIFDSNAACIDGNSPLVTETLVVVTQGPSVEISRIQFFQNGKEVEKYVDSKIPLTVKITAGNAGQANFLGSISWLFKDNKGIVVSIPADKASPQSIALTASSTDSNSVQLVISGAELQKLKESTAYLISASLSKGGVWFSSRQASFVIGKKAPASIPEMPLPLVLLVLAGILAVFKLKSKQSNNFK